MDFIGFWKLFRDSAYVFFFAFLQGGRPRVLSKFPPENLNKSNQNWVHGFHIFLMFFCIFAGGGRRVLGELLPKYQTKQQSELGT